MTVVKEAVDIVPEDGDITQGGIDITKEEVVITPEDIDLTRVAGKITREAVTLIKKTPPFISSYRYGISILSIPHLFLRPPHIKE